jgi:microcystin-dependent protein
MYFTGNAAAAKPVVYLMRFDDQNWFREALFAAITSLSRKENWQQDGDISPSKAATFGAYALQYFDLAADMIGTVQAFAGDTTYLDPNFLICNGATYNVADFPRLGAMLRATRGATTFQVPDLRALFLVGVNFDGLTGENGDRSGYGLWAQGGEDSHALTSGEMPAHAHSDAGHVHTDAGHSHVTAPALPNVTTIGAGVPQPTAVPGVAATGLGFANISSGNANIQNTGGNEAHENRPPYFAVVYVIVAEFGGR